MSDLINFESPKQQTNSNLLPSPLIPAPVELPKVNEQRESNDSGISCINRRSLENNPFDVIMKKVTDYEKNKEDPFERVIEEAAIIDTDLVLEENDASIITDLNNTNLIADTCTNAGLAFENCDSGNVSLTSCNNNNLSILNDSALNDSLLDHRKTIRTKDNEIDSVLKNDRYSFKPCIDDEPRSTRSYSSASSNKQDFYLPSNSIKYDGLKNHGSVFSLPSKISDISLAPSKIKLSSDLPALKATSFTKDDKSQKFNDKSDLIKKFNAIKKRMSFEVDLSKNEKKETFSTKMNVEKLVDINTSSNTIFKNCKPNDNDIICNEAKALAKTFEKLATDKKPSVSSSIDKDLLLKTKLKFDRNKETVDNLIDLPTSPTKIINVKMDKKPDTNEDQILANDNVKDLENEFIDENDCNQKAKATALLLDLQKIINKKSNPSASKVLNDLEKILGVKCDSTEILKNCLQSSSQNKVTSNLDLHEQNYDRENRAESKFVDNKVEDKSKIIESENKVDLENADQMIVKNLLTNLSGIVKKKDEDNIDDFIKSLNLILNVANELSTKNKDSVKSGIDETKIVKKKSFEASPRTGNKSLNASNSSVKDTKKTQLTIGSRFSINQSQFSNTSTDTIKSKFKKIVNNTAEGIVKKGPLKATIPMGCMQKQISTNQRTSLPVTPVKSKSSSNLSNCTPVRSHKINKLSPRLLLDDEKKNKSIETTERRSIYSFNSSLRRSNSFRNNKRLDNTVSPQKKKPQTPKRNSESGTESRLPRFNSPRPVIKRISSFNDSRNAISTPTKITVPKISSDKKYQRYSVASPLRSLNKLEQKPMNLIPRLGRQSIQKNFEKENYV